MKIITKYVFFLVLLLSVTGVGEAGNTFRNIGSRDGLCDNSVSDIRQDKLGMMWFATWNGLCRYDGMLFYTFRHAFNDDGSIVNNHVNIIEIGGKGLWASTLGGLDYLSFSTGKFSRCTVNGVGAGGGSRLSDVVSVVCNGGNTVVTDSHGNVYACREGSNPTLFSRLMLRRKIVSLCHYRDGLLVGAGPDGVYLLSADGRKIISELRCKMIVGSFAKVYYSRNADLVFVGNGIGYPCGVFSVSGGKINEAKADIPSNVRDIADYGRGTAFATDGGGLVILENGVQTTYMPSNSNLCGDALYSVSTDRDGNLWLGSYRKGISMMPSHGPWWTLTGRSPGQLTYDIVTALVPDGDKMYVGLDGGGLNVIDRKTGRLIRSVNSGDGSLPDNHVVAMVKDDRYLYMAVYSGGFVRMSLADGTFKTYHFPPSSDVDADNIWCLCDDGQGRIWVGGPDVGVFSNAGGGGIKALPRLRGVSCSGMTRHGRYIYISSTHSGIYKVDSRSCRVVDHYTDKEDSRIKLLSSDIKYVYADRKGTVWFTSEASGFFALDEKRGTVTAFGDCDGLTSGAVTSITEDADGNLWLGTLNGMFRFNPYNRMFVRLDEDTMLPSNYTYGASCFYDGTVYMGSLDGMLSFSPASVSTGGAGARVGFISLRLMNDNNSELPLFGSEPEKITLSHDQNFFVLNFTVPDMYAPRRLHFSCRLEGLEDDWRELSGRREVAYTNVPPGHYKFYVRYTDSTGKWSRPSVLDITITPPWYATTLAQMLWTLLALGLVVAGAWLYLHELAIKNKIRISKIEEDAQRKLGEAKMNFYTNITHELRTPVFLITAQLEELLDAHKSILQIPSSYLYAMYRSAKKLNTLVSRVIDFRKLDSGVLRLNTGRIDVSAFCRNLVEDYEELCAQKHISFTFSCQEGPVMLDCDAEKLEIILSNLVSNAFKYTKEGGKVSLKVTDEHDRVTFAVSDNGIGIVEKMRDTIFQSFFRTERAVHQSGGDGLGLSFVKQLVELHGGSISVDSEVNVGSTFTFFIPRKEAADDDMDSSQPSNGEMSACDRVSASLPLDDIGGKPAAEASAPVNPAAVHTVLIIDDEPAIVSLIERSLCSDYKVYKAYDGEEGLAIVRQKLPDIVICDIMMPRMDGLKFLSVIKSDKALSHIKVIIFTAKASEEDMLRAYDGGADSYLTKPLSLKVLRMRVDRLVAQGDNAAVLAGSVAAEKRAYNKEEQVFLMRCREVIDDNLANPDFSIELLADKLAMSHSALYKKVKVITGMSLISFINDYKIYVAVQLFRQGVTSVEDVSARCGFRDVKNFREVFKRKMNTTPKQFVQSL